MKLAQLQQSFQAHVLRGEAAIAPEITGTERAATAARLGVYYDAYSLRLAEVLGESFPAVRAGLGASRFTRLIGEFTRTHPSTVRSARDYGAQLPQWLASHLRGSQATGIADLARFEWAVAGAFDARDHTPLGAESLAGVAPAQWPELRFTFSPSLRRLTVHSNCVAWWKFACAEQPRPSRWRGTCPQHWLVWRRELSVFYRRLPQAQARALDAALAGHSFGQLCAQLASASGAATMLHAWFSEGLLSGAVVAAGVAD